MQFKKIAAIAGSALMGALALAGPALASTVSSINSISDLVSVSDSTVSFPIFVVGANAQTADVAGAVGMAVKMAGSSKTTSVVTVSGAGASVSGGATMGTAANPLTMWDNIASSKTVLTGTDISGILPSGTFEDADGVEYSYSQYLNFNNTGNSGRVVYDRPSGGDTPALGLKFSTSSAGNYVFNYQLVFTKQVASTINASSLGSLVNTNLNILGKTYTITAASNTSSTALKLNMLSGKNSQTVITGTPATYTVDDNTYTVDLVAVGTLGGVDAVTMAVSGSTLSEGGETLQIKNGQTRTLSDGTIVGVTSIFRTTKTGAIDSATVFVGADKVELSDDDVTETANYYTSGFKIGGTTQSDIHVRITGNITNTQGQISKIEVKYQPTLEKFIDSGESLTDPAFGAFKILFGGISPALDSTARETLTLLPSGSTGARLTMTDKGGNELGFDWVYFNTSAGDSSNLTLADTAGYKIHVVEGEFVHENEYVIVSQNDFGHALRLLDSQTAATATTKFQDWASGETIEVTGGNTTMYLDGQAYSLCAYNSTTVRLTWDASATNDCSFPSSTGSYVTVYPIIESSKGAKTAFIDNVTVAGLTADTNYTWILPTGNASVNSSIGGSTTIGQAKYTFGSGGTSVTIAGSDNAASPTDYDDPVLMLVEEEEENNVKNVIMLPIGHDSTNSRIILTGTPTFTGTVGNNSAVGTSTTKKWVDEYGSLITQSDTTTQGRFEIGYPDVQSIATIGVGATPSVGATGTAGEVTTDVVIPITSDIVMLDSEIGSAKNTHDLVLVGGPCINTLVAELATAGTFDYGCADWPGRDFGMVKLVNDAFASGYTALVVAGTRATDTDLAARVVQTGTGLSGITGDTAEVTGTVTSPTVTEV
jgi:hypothetical protein